MENKKIEDPTRSTYPHFLSLASFLNLEKQIQNPEEDIDKIQYLPTRERFSTV